MNIREYFRAFTDDELTRGAELFFSGDLKNIISRVHKGNMSNDLTQKEYQVFPDLGTVSISGEWCKEDAWGKASSEKCNIRIHEKTGLICDNTCPCEEHKEDGYGCAHVTALLAWYMTNRNGDDFFRGTRLETLLKNYTGAEEPFEQGALVRTDQRILSLLKGSETRPLPVWKKTVRMADPVRIECELSLSQVQKMMVSIRIGTTGRTVQVRDLPQLIRAYQDEDMYVIGKKEYQMGRQYCEPRTAAVLDFMAGLVSASEKRMYNVRLFPDTGSNCRFMNLEGTEFDNFMELCDGWEIIYANDDSSNHVELGRKGLSAMLRKKTYGAELTIGGASRLFNTGSWLYLKDKEGIFRIRIESTEKAHELLSLLNMGDKMYIRASEIGAVCRNLLPVFIENGNVVTKGMEIDDYRREKPEFSFNLDYPADRTLSCVPYAIYRRQGFKHQLYDDVSDAARRDAETESEIAAILPDMFDMLDKETGTLYSELDEEGLYDFMKNCLPRLESIGSVMVTDSLKKNRVRALPSMNVGVSVESGQLTMSLKSSGLSTFEIAEILGAYKKKKKYYRLRSGEFFSFEDTENSSWNIVSELFANYGSNKDPENIRMPAFRALYLKEMLEGKEDTRFDPTAEYRKLISDMDVAGASNFLIPNSFKGVLRPYQKEGFNWIKMLKRCGFGGILADDMGLGKTIQILSFIVSEKKEGREGDDLRTLVVCPASLVYNWQREIETFARELTCVVIAGNAATRKELIESRDPADVWITSYDLLKRDIEYYKDIHFANEVVDEAQFVKNQNTQAAHAVRLVDSSFRMALTGTPIENYLSELWSIMDYLMPGFLFAYSRFQSEYETPIVARKDEETLDRLRRMVHPFILRRMKKDVLKDLPDKMEEIISVRMDGEQKKLYQAHVDEIRLMLDKVSASEFRTSKLQFLAKLTQLRQVCCDPSLLYENYKGESAKLEACLQLVREAVDSGHKLLLFSQFTSMLDIICERLHIEKIEYHRIDGSVSKEKRMEMVDAFASDDVKVFLISLKAGGTGLNLTAADIVIHYDPWWNQAAQDQATDRTHRIGQTQRVNVYELIVQDTVEERIQKIKEGKSKLVEDVLSGGEISSSAINKDDMLQLLQ